VQSSLKTPALPGFFFARAQGCFEALAAFLTDFL